jgi:hypothetical protein
VEGNSYGDGKMELKGQDRTIFVNLFN